MDSSTATAGGAQGHAVADRWAEIRHETAIIAHIERRDLAKRLAMLAIFAPICLYLDRLGAGLALAGAILLAEAISFWAYGRVLAKPQAIPRRLIFLIWGLNGVGTLLYLGPAVIMAQAGNAAFAVFGLLWLFGVIVHILNSFAATPRFARLSLAPVAATAVPILWSAATGATLPGTGWDLAFIALGLVMFAFNLLESLGKQADTQSALALARAQSDARLTALEAALAARGQAERRFQDIDALSDDWFWEFDPDLRIRHLGHSFAASTGLDPARALGLSLRDVAQDPAMPLDFDWPGFARIVAARQPFAGFLVTYRDHRPGLGAPRVWLRFTGTPFADAQGGFAGYRGVCSNVTPYLAATERAEAASRAKSQFLAVMSHELRTPLTAVLGMADLLRPRMQDPESVEMIDTIRSSGEGLLAVLNDVLDLARIEAGKLTIEPLPFDPAELVARAQALFRPRAQAAGLELSVHVDDGVGARVGDANRILQVLTNLIGNAIKFTPQGGVRLRLAADGPAGLAISIDDDGIGMTEEAQRRVFHEFEQAESSTARRFGGTGLGLAITRQLVELMGGTITVASRVGQGTRFDVRLPAPPAPAQALEPPAVVAADDVGVLAGLSVLVADDNAANRRILAAILGGLGLRVTLAEDGRAAVAAAAASPFDLLLLDISMPGLDGPAALAAIRRAEVAARRVPRPALAVTAHAMRHQIEEFLAAGFAGHIAKPYARAALVATLLAHAPKGPRTVAPSTAPVGGTAADKAAASDPTPATRPPILGPAIEARAQPLTDQTRASGPPSRARAGP